MPLTSAQICQRASVIAKQTGNLAPAGQWLNVVLSDLCQTYDFDLARRTTVFNFNPATTSNAAYPNNTPGSGPYTLPTDFLRCDKGEAIWFLNGVPYPLVACDLSEYDAQVQTAGFQSYPAIMAVDRSLQTVSTGAAVAIFWPPASGAYQFMLRYRAQMSDIGSGTVQGSWNPGVTAPESSTVIPWFENQDYLISKVASNLAMETGDSRLEALDRLAEAKLTRYLKLTNDNSDRAKTVSLDRRRFGINFSKLPVTKTTGW